MDCIIKTGPSVTLAEIGAAVGLSAATVMQRFGSKRNLMRRVIELRVARGGTMSFSGEGDAVERVIDGLVRLTDWMKTPDDVANVAAALHTNVADPEFRELVYYGFHNQRRLIAQGLQNAIDAGKLKPCDTAATARLMQLTVLGAQQSWAIEPNGSLQNWITECLRICMTPLRVTDGETTPPR